MSAAAHSHAHLPLTLAQHLHSQLRGSHPQALSLILDVLALLGQGHASGQIHGTLGPEQIFLSPQGMDLLEITAWGSDKSSPERIAQDVQSVAALLQTLLTGHGAAPIAPSLRALVEQAVGGQFPSAQALGQALINWEASTCTHIMPGHAQALEKMLARMREQAVAKLGADRVTDGSILKLPYPDNHFDFALALEVFRYLDTHDNAAGLAEVRRVLKPGGRLFATFVNRWALDGFHTLVALRKLRGTFTGNGPKAHTEFETPSGLAARLTAAGFTKAETHGAMFAPLRLTYKLGPIGPLMGRIVNPLDRVLSDNAVTKPFAGHLIAIATK